jgi:hypothetical protein
MALKCCYCYKYDPRQNACLYYYEYTNQADICHMFHIEPDKLLEQKKFIKNKRYRMDRINNRDYAHTRMTNQGLGRFSHRNNAPRLWRERGGL